MSRNLTDCVPVRRRRLAVALALASLTGASALAAPPDWWFQGSPPVINGASENNKGPANIGQGKFMAMRALDAVRTRFGQNSEIAQEIESKLFKASESDTAGVFYPIRPASPSAAWLDAQKAPLQIGALKALALPFYDAFHSRLPGWLEGELVANGTKDPVDAGNYYPWTSSAADDNNLSLATIGQLKAVFALRFETLADSDGDGFDDAWELLTFGHLGQGPDDDADGDGRTNRQELDAGTNPMLMDTDGDGIPDGADSTPTSRDSTATTITNALRILTPSRP